MTNCQTFFIFSVPFPVQETTQGLADITLQKAAGHVDAFPKILKNFETARRIQQTSSQYPSLWQAIKKIYSWKSNDLGSKQAVDSTLQKSLCLTVQPAIACQRSSFSSNQPWKQLPQQSNQRSFSNSALVKFQHSQLLLNTATERNSSTLALVTFNYQVCREGCLTVKLISMLSSIQRLHLWCPAVENLDLVCLIKFLNEGFARDSLPLTNNPPTVSCKLMSANDIALIIEPGAQKPLLQLPPRT